MNEYLTDAATKVSYHKPIDIKNQVSSTRLTTEANCNFVYISLLVEVGFDLFGKSIKLGAKEPPSFLHQQRGIVAIGGGVANNGTVVQLTSATRVDMSLKLDDRIFLVVEMKKTSFFKLHKTIFRIWY